MGLFGRKKEPEANISLTDILGEKLANSFACYPTLTIGNSIIHIPIWYVFKDGHSIDLNNPSLIIEDWSGEFEKYRHLGRMRIREWERFSGSRFGERLSPPNIVFYEK